MCIYSCFKNFYQKKLSTCGKTFYKALTVKYFSYESILIYSSKMTDLQANLISDSSFFSVPDESKVHSLAGHKLGKKFFLTDFIFFFLENTGCV